MRRRWGTWSLRVGEVCEYGEVDDEDGPHQQLCVVQFQF